MENTLKEKNDDIAILDSTLENRDLEIIRLRDELNDKYHAEKVEVLTCDNCDSTFETKDKLELNIKELHSKKCSHCGESFVDEGKFKKHTCRIKIKNPSSTSLYMKNWYIKYTCISVYSVLEEKEVIVLHSSNCVNRQNCSVCPRSLYHSIRVIDNGLIHLNAHCVLKCGEVHWDLIDCEMDPE